MTYEDVKYIAGEFGRTVTLNEGRLHFSFELIDFFSCSIAKQFGFRVVKIYCLVQWKENSS